MYKAHTVCRACNCYPLFPVFDLGVQPLANNFIRRGESHAGHAPLKVMVCPKCTLAQLSVTVDPEVLYSNYLYVTSTSDTMRNHIDQLAKDIMVMSNGRGTVLEIGSNDGTLLARFKELGYEKVVGIDPAENLAPIASAKGVRTITSLFDETSAKDSKVILGRVDVIIARHVFCHIDNWRAFIANLEEIMHRDTLVAIEVPYCGSMLDSGEWDTIYHEHTSYLTIRSMIELLAPTQLRVNDIIRYAIHGGTIVLILRRCDHDCGSYPIVEQMMKAEEGIDRRWAGFGNGARAQMSTLRDRVRQFTDEGMVVCGYGASAKSTVLINACGIAPDLAFVTDTTPQKIGRFIPGTTVPILEESELMTRSPDYAIMCCWNYREEVLRKNKQYLANGGHFIIPVPVFEIV